VVRSSFRIAGYGLLVWHYSTLLIFLSHRGLQILSGNFKLLNLVERAPVPLLGLVLVLSGEKICGFSSSYPGSCGWGVVWLLPLGVSSGFRIYQQNNQQLSSQLNQQTTQMKQLRNLLSKATTSEELSSILASTPPKPCQRLGILSK